MTGTRIVIVGGGYAGCAAANRLKRKVPSADITLVNARPDFVERVRLHQRLAGTGDAGTPLTEMVGDAVTVKVGAVETIGDGELTFTDGSVLGFDKLIYAAGGAPQAPKGSLAVGCPEEAAAAHDKLKVLVPGAVVTVVGGGLTGIETAAEIAEARPDLDVRLLSRSAVGSSLHPKAQQRVQAELAALGVELVDGTYDPDAANGDLVLWAIADEVSTLAARSGLAVDADGRLDVDDHLVSVSDPRIFGAGDAAGTGQRMSCQSALPLGAHAADNLARSLAGTPLKPFSMSYVGQNVSLGRKRGVIQTSKRDDTPRSFFIGGRKAAVIKEQVCAGAKTVARTGLSTRIPGPR